MRKFEGPSPKNVLIAKKIANLQAKAGVAVCADALQSIFEIFEVSE